MPLEFIGDIFQTGTFIAAVDRPSANEVVTLNNVNQLKRFSLEDLEQIGSTISVGSGSAAVTMVAPACCLVSNSSSTTYQVVDVESGYAVNVTGGNTIPVTNKGQQSAGNTSTMLAMTCSSTNGNLVKTDASALTNTVLTPASLSGTTARCVITKGTNWIIGTASGTVVEINSSGTTIQTITLPTTPNSGSAPTLLVSGLSYDSSSDRIVITTTAGVMFVYEYSTQTLLNRAFTGTSNSAGRGAFLCDSINSTCLIAYTGVPRPNNAQVVTNLVFQKQPITESVFISEINSDCVGCGINSSINVAWIAFNSTRLRVFRTGGLTTTSVETQIQDESGITLGGRIIRLRKLGVGRYFVESDQTISSEATDISSTVDSHFIEIAITGSEPSESWDVREFDT